ncbi:MAG: glycosyltransferase family 39 protein [Deltaproteobacteria bacterium]|nr:glycosyltransferase family 39 protein [Deltaproteobacteria bacterium]
MAASALFHVWYAGLLELSPQEAYYWLYGQRLDWSYFDHPPLAAWTIRALGELLGDSERAIRSAALLHTSLFSLFFFLTARRLLGPRGAVAAVGLALVSPLFSLGQVIITPDVPLLAMWAAAMYFTVRALQEERGEWLLLAGLATGLAALGKYTGWLLAPQIFLCLLLDPRGRRQLRSPWPWLGLLLGFVAFGPVLYWNATHGWASFGFQVGDRAAGARSGPRLTNFLRFAGLQLAVPSPILAVALVVAAFGALRRRAELAFRVGALFSVPALLLFAGVSFFVWVKGNWPIVVWPGAMLAALAFWQEGRAPRWLVRSAVGLAAFFSVYLHLGAVLPALPYPARDDTTRGWRALAERVQAERQALPGAFLIGCYYKTATLLHYYLPDRPETFSSEALGGNGLQYRYWTDPRTLDGRTGLVVVDPRDRESKWCPALRERCVELTPLPPLPIERTGMWNPGGLVPRGVVAFQLYRCRYRAAPAP